MKILVLGGTGAMGAHLLPILEAAGNEVYITSRSDRQSDSKRINYITGDAHDAQFLREVLKTRFDAIVDFMAYNTDEFRNRMQTLLSAADHYMFLSTSRVYAKSETPITEESPRLLDVCTDKEYLSTDEYALTKARQEDLLHSSGKRNYTIIRPYITFSEQRLQLGVFEKERWLYRALRGKTMLFPKDIAKCTTTMTYAYDVASVMAKLIGRKSVMGEVVQIASSDTITWQNVLDLYLDTIERIIGTRPRVKYSDNSDWIKCVSHTYAVEYDRLYDRSFDSKKAAMLCGEEIKYTPVRTGLPLCLERFLNGSREFRQLSWKYEAYVDRVFGEKTSLQEIQGSKNKLKYSIARYTPYFNAASVYSFRKDELKKVKKG